MAGSYYSVLGEVHRLLRPANYLEIGFKNGRSAALALSTTRVIAVDPRPIPEYAFQPRFDLVVSTSSEFFNSDQPAALLKGESVDLAFIDGLHLAETVVSDFRSCFEISSPDGLIVLHDVLLQEKVRGSREPTGSDWAGDTWRAMSWILRFADPLRILFSDVGPSGLAFVPVTAVSAIESPSPTELMSCSYSKYEAQIESLLVGSRWSDIQPKLSRLLA